MERKTKSKLDILSLCRQARAELKEGKNLRNYKDGILQQIDVANMTALKAFGTAKHEELLEKVDELKKEIKKAENLIFLCRYEIVELGNLAYGMVIDAGYDDKSAQRVSDKFSALGRKLVDLEDKSDED